MTKPELEKKIFLHLTKVDFSTSDEMKNIFKCSEYDLMDIIKNNTKTNSEPLGFIIKNDETTPTRYSIEQTNYLTIHNQVENYLKGINGILSLFYRNLSSQSNLLKSDSDKILNLNNKGKTIFDNISLILDRIQQLSFLITYYKSMDKIPKNMISKADEDHEKCLNMYSKIIKKLKSILMKEKINQEVIELYLFKHQFVVNHLNSSI
ncbi:hypothetical protein NMSP_0833 [Candidatus Nitrosomarinus catalina]|uniref:Uncharacterized protein n=1 Tax=Candidatus Nitrosomarinus catalinensis TaxID=1898749 RepID=A0A2Z2HK52_9ARCH|nr:hypothetical protein [Candidatus Nitrosomarinus catalina]ARS64452.1 hypothetical protein NMSP_0833 [Candidatus Nitrosomarinus catalina]